MNVEQVDAVTQEQEQPESEDQMGVSTYERASSWVVALNIIGGFLVVLMFLVWLTAITLFRNTPVQVRLIEPTGREDHAKGYERDPEEPGLEEVEDISEPRLEKTFEAVIHTVSNTAASLTSIDTKSASSSRGPGVGDNRRPGKGSNQNDDDVIPSWERWRINLTARSERAFAAQLDELDIHLGLFGGGDSLIYYAHDFRSGIKKYRREGGRKEERLFFAPFEPNARKFTVALLAKAGYPTGGKYAVHFYPDSAEKELSLAESKYAGGRGLIQIRRTYFAVKRQGGRLTFAVTRQEYR